MKIFIISFGCQMAFADSEEMLRPFRERGCALTPELEEADAVLVNTCTVRAHAEQRALSQIGRLRAWKERRPGRLLVVAGCAAERLKDGLRARFPHVDLVAGAKSIEEFPQLVDQSLHERFTGEDHPGPDLKPAPSPASAFVTIMRGCNYSCSYCIVPAVRGRELYRNPGTILAEAKERVAAGAKEIMLLGQTVNSYRSGDMDFADLLRAVDGIAGLKRIRFMSPHPYYVNARMIAAMAGCGKVCAHLHLPVQSGSDRMLRAMRRNYTRGQYLDRLGALRRAVPGIAVTTDLIVGFPGETESDLRETLELLDAAGFDAAYCFKFSPRAGTEAAGLAEPVPEPLVEERHQRVLGRVLRESRRRAEALVGSTQEVLVEAPGLGRTPGNRTVALGAEAPGPGATVAVRITGLRRNTLIGTIMEMQPAAT